MLSKTASVLAFVLATSAVASALPQDGGNPPHQHPRRERSAPPPGQDKPKPEAPPRQKPLPPSTAQPEPPKPREISPGDQKLDTALDELSTKVQARKVDAADYERVRTALRDRAAGGTTPDPLTQARTARIEQSIDVLDERFKNQKLSPAHVDMIREQLIDERLDQAIERWRNAVAAGKVSEDEYRAIAQQLNRRAEVAQSFDPEALQMRQHLQTRLEALQARAKDTPLKPDDVAEFRKDLLDQRLEHSLGNLERRAADQDLTRAELERTRGILEDHPDLTRDDAELGALHQRLGNALSALEQKVATGKVDPSEVGKLRALLIHKAREAGMPAPPKQPPANPPR
jgi:hypothetical protein